MSDAPPPPAAMPAPATTPAPRPSGLRPPTSIGGRLARPSGLPKPPTPMTPYPPTPVTTSAPTPRASGVSVQRPLEQARIKKINEEVSRMKLADVEEEDLEETPYYNPKRKDSEVSRRSSSSGSGKSCYSIAEFENRCGNKEQSKKKLNGLLSAEALWENARRLSEAGVRRCSDASVVLTEDTDSFIIGDKVWVGGTKPGQIAYIGETQFAPGEWAGVVLDEPIGKNDGSVAGTRYFQCEPKRGVFSRLTRLTRSPLISGEGNDVGEPTSPPSRRPSSAMSHSSSIRENSFTSPSSPTPPDLKVGERVIVMSSQGSKAGVLRYIGATEFAAGIWAGVELDDPLGKNDGSVGNKRYFECMPKFGLFAPVAKVSRSPSATPGVRRGICSVHHAATTNSTSSLKRRGSKESVASTAGSTSSALKSPAPRVRLGVNSLGQKPANRATPPTATTQATLQSTLRDKEQYIEQLLKERELERAEVTRAASQVDDAEQKLSNLKLEFEQYREQMEAQMQDNQLMLERIMDEKNEFAALLDEERRRMEDLQFRYEEAAIAKTDMERRRQDQKGQDEVHLERIKELEKALEDERRRAEELELESNRAFEEEEALAKVREEAEQELRSKMEELKTELIAKVTLVEEKDQALDVKEQELSKISGEFEELKKKIIAQEEKEGSVNTEAQRLRDENGKLLERITSTEERVKQVLAEKEKLEGTVAELQAFKVEMIKNESDMSVRQATCVRELEGQLKVMSEEQKSLSEKYQSLLSQSKKDIEELQKAKDEELNLLKQTLQKQAEEASKIQQSELEKLNQMILNLKQESCKELEELKSRKDAEIEGLKESLMKHGDEALKAKQLELEKMSQLFTNLKEESSKEIERLRNQKDIEINEVRQSMKKHEEEVIQATKAEVEKAMQSLTQFKEESSKELERLKVQKEEEMENLKQSLIKREDEALKAKQTELEKLTEILSSLQTEKKNEFEDLKKLHCAEISSLKDSIQSREDEIVALKSQVETMKTTLEGQNTVNKEAVSEIESKMTELNSEREKLLKEREMLLPQLAKLESEVSSLREEKKKSNEVLVENERYLNSINSQIYNLLSVMGGKPPEDIPAQQGDEKTSESKGASDTSMRLKCVGIMLQSCTELGLKLKCMMEELEDTKKRESEKSSSFQKEKESLESMAQSLKALLEKQEKDIQDRQNEINLLKAEKSQANKYKSLMENLEKEKAQLERKVVELQVAVAQSKANANNEDSTYKTLMEEKEMAQGQIDFLNSVIVDMQRKNDDLKARVEILEIGITPADADELNLNGIKPRMVAPRLFCDICDVFDLHDTEDCPRQSSESSPPPLIRHRPNSPEGGKGKRIIPERPYCDTCEIFGHATQECEDGETY